MKLTIQQLQALEKALPEVLCNKFYFLQLFVKQFQQDLAAANIQCEDIPSPNNLLRKRDILERVTRWLSSFKFPLLDSLRDQVLIESLRLDLLLRTPNLRSLLEYLGRPKEICGWFNSEYSEKLKQRTDYNYHSFWHDAHGFKLQNFSENDLIQ